SSPTSLDSEWVEARRKPLVFRPYPRLSTAVFRPSVSIWRANSSVWGLFPVPPVEILPTTKTGRGKRWRRHRPETYSQVRMRLAAYQIMDRGNSMSRSNFIGSEIYVQVQLVPHF